MGISPKLLYRWQQAQVIAEVASVEVAHDPEVRALRAAKQRLAQELNILKKALVIFGQPPPVSTYQHIAHRQARVPVRQLCYALRVAPSA